MPAELLKNVRLLDAVTGRDDVVDVLLDEGLVRAIAPSLTEIPDDAAVQDCTGWVLGTGLVDLYSHSGEPGNESRETLESLRQAAADGGFTRVALLPDTKPTLDSPGTIEGIQSQLKGSGSRLQVWGALTQGVEGQQMTELAELAMANIVGCADGKPLSHPRLVQRILEYAHPLQLPIALWCCDRELQGDGVVREGMDAIRLGLPSVPAIAETSALATVLECVAATGTPIHLMRISTARSVAMIAQAKAEGLPITASTTWMHLLLNTQALSSYDPNVRLDPPLGTPDDQQALVQAVESGVIDAIAIDHAAYTYEEKTVAFAVAPPGAIGLELALPLLWEAFVATGQWSALTLWQALSTRPLKCLGQELGAIAPNQPAELTLFNPAEPWTVDPQNLKSKSANTYWLGKNLTGRVVKTWNG
jgi:dihydroorotase